MSYMYLWEINLIWFDLIWYCNLLLIRHHVILNTLRPRQNARHFADDIFKCIFSNENAWIPIAEGPIKNIPAFIQIWLVAFSVPSNYLNQYWHRLPTHICVIRPQWVKPVVVYLFRNPNQNATIFMRENVFQDVYCKMSEVSCSGINMSNRNNDNCMRARTARVEFFPAQWERINRPVRHFCFNHASAWWWITNTRSRLLPKVDRKLTSPGVGVTVITSSNGNIYRVTGPLCGEFTGHRWFPLAKASDAELWCFFICAWINGWINNREAGDWRRHRAHYEVI